jgi:hypothetical protein
MPPAKEIDPLRHADKFWKRSMPPTRLNGPEGLEPEYASTLSLLQRNRVTTALAGFQIPIVSNTRSIHLVAFSLSTSGAESSRTERDRYLMQNVVFS